MLQLELKCLLLELECLSLMLDLVLLLLLPPTLQPAPLLSPGPSPAPPRVGSVACTLPTRGGMQLCSGCWSPLAKCFFSPQANQNPFEYDKALA